MPWLINRYKLVLVGSKCIAIVISIWDTGGQTTAGKMCACIAGVLNSPESLCSMSVLCLKRLSWGGFNRLLQERKGTAPNGCWHTFKVASVETSTHGYAVFVITTPVPRPHPTQCSPTVSRCHSTDCNDKRDNLRKILNPVMQKQALAVTVSDRDEIREHENSVLSLWL